jgi:hypothetical protein
MADGKWQNGRMADVNARYATSSICHSHVADVFSGRWARCRSLTQREQIDHRGVIAGRGPGQRRPIFGIHRVRVGMVL